MLAGRRVLLGITGSISAYKAADLARLFIKAGATVRVVMSPDAQRFITPLTLEALTTEPVLTAETESWAGSACNHIGYAKWAEVLVIAPATANTLNKLAHGIADHLLLQTALACRALKVIAPAANTAMMEHPATASALKLLRLMDAEIVPCSCGELACGDVGSGRLAEIEAIFWFTARALLRDDFWDHRGVVISGGGTQEPIDAVRMITNHSSGKMAIALAEAAFVRGADVCLIGPVSAGHLPIHTIEAKSAENMGQKLQDALREAKKGVLTRSTLTNGQSQLIQKKPYLLMAAAVSDYRAKYPQQGKLKKAQLGESWKLELTQNPDLLSRLDRSGVVSVGFKAEFDAENAQSHAERMLQEKQLDAVCLNVLGQAGVNFGSDETRMTLLAPDGSSAAFKGSKLAVAAGLLEAFKGLDR